MRVYALVCLWVRVANLPKFNVNAAYLNCKVFCEFKTPEIRICISRLIVSLGSQACRAGTPHRQQQPPSPNFHCILLELELQAPAVIIIISMLSILVVIYQLSRDRSKIRAHWTQINSCTSA